MENIWWKINLIDTHLSSVYCHCYTGIVNMKINTKCDKIKSYKKFSFEIQKNNLKLVA